LIFDKRTLTPILLAAIALAGCGAADSNRLAATQMGTDATATASAPNLNENQTADAAEATLRREFATLQSGDLRAVYAMLTRDCKQLFGGPAEFETLFADSLDAVELTTGSKMSEMRIGAVKLVEFTPERATFLSKLYLADGTPVAEYDIDEGEPEVLVYEDDEWKLTCDPFESEMEFEPVGEVIGEDFETSTTVTTVPPNWPTSTTTTTTTISRMTTR
jgi:hypothetical protein